MDGQLGISWPAALLARAEIAGNGEPLWPATELPDAIDWVERSSLAILAIEVFGRVDLARGVFQRELRIETGWDQGESWERYVARAATLARAQVRSDCEGGAAGAADLYFLAVVPEASVSRLGR